MHHNRRPPIGFALVDMVIVILTLGIIAVALAPRLLHIDNTVDRETTRQRLLVLRSAIELYHARSGVYPSIHRLPDSMESMLSGEFPAPNIGSASGDRAVHYDLDSNTKTPVAPDASQPGGWAYKPANGSLKLNIDPSEIGADW
jgi:general secretion pathway protein G